VNFSLVASAGRHRAVDERGRTLGIEARRRLVGRAGAERGAKQVVH
jgi:hypothetical protein